MIYNTSPLPLFTNTTQLDRFKALFNDRVGSTFLRRLNVGNVIMTRYNGKLRYVPEMLDNSLKTRVLSVNLGTQFQKDHEIGKEKHTFQMELEGNNCVFKDVEFFHNTGFGIPIELEGIVMAEYFPEVSHLNILFDFDSNAELFSKQFGGSKHENTGFKFAALLIKILEVLVAIKKIEDFKVRDWKNESKREENLKMMKEKSTKLLKSKIEQLKIQITQRESKLTQYASSIVNENRLLFEDRLSLDSLSQGESSIVEKLIAELDAIAANVYVKAVAYSENMFEFITNYLPIYHGDVIYAGDEYLVQVNMDTAVVAISSTSGKGYRGHWTTNDPHPHVNGSDGKPCLGSIGQTLADMVSKHELYVITVLMTEYLKAVNTDDAAGRRISESGRKKLTKEEHDKLMAYENEPIYAIEEAEKEVEIVKAKPKKASKKAAPEVANVQPVQAQVFTQEPLAQEVSSICVVCGTDVYGHGSYQPVVDIRDGQEVFTVACNRCVNSENGFVPGTYGIPAYVGTTPQTARPIPDEITLGFRGATTPTTTMAWVDDILTPDAPTPFDEEEHEEEIGEEWEDEE